MKAKMPVNTFVALVSHFLEPLSKVSGMQCGTVCGIVHRYAVQLGLKSEWLECKVKREGHYFLKLEGNYLDLTYRQFSPKSAWPIWIPSDHHEIDLLWQKRKKLPVKKVNQIIATLDRDGRTDLYAPALVGITEAINWTLNKSKPNGRPRSFDYDKARKLSKKFSLREVAEKLGVTHGAVQAALKKGKSK